MIIIWLTLVAHDIWYFILQLLLSERFSKKRDEISMKVCSELIILLARSANRESTGFSLLLSYSHTNVIAKTHYPVFNCSVHLIKKIHRLISTSIAFENSSELCMHDFFLLLFHLFHFNLLCLVAKWAIMV